jgi:hypothetical protein
MVTAKNSRNRSRAVSSADATSAGNMSVGEGREPARSSRDLRPTRRLGARFDHFAAQLVKHLVQVAVRPAFSSSRPLFIDASNIRQQLVAQIAVRLHLDEVFDDREHCLGRIDKMALLDLRQQPIGHVAG